MFRWIERLTDPFPLEAPQAPPARFLPFAWGCSKGVRGLMVTLVVLTACIAAFEAMLFTMIGSIVDWLGGSPTERWWDTHRDRLLSLAAVVLLSPLLVAAHSLVKQQCLSVSFTTRLRWNFHRHMLTQSMKFFQDDFAGRVSSTVIQTAMAVRDFWMISCDMVVFVAIYFATVLGVLGGFTHLLLAPFLGWLILYTGMLVIFIPRIGRASAIQSEARSTMAGRIGDAYTNISTVKLFSHTQREADFARQAMHEFVLSGRDQMRLVSGLTLANHALSMCLVVCTGALSLWLWSDQVITIGALAAATAMALRLNGIAQNVMWQLAGLFDNVGTIHDGIATLSKSVAIQDRTGAPPLLVRHGEIVFERVRFGYGSAKPVIRDIDLRIRPGEKIGLVGRSGAGKSTLLSLLLRFHEVEGGRLLIDGQEVSAVSQDSLRAQIGMVTQDTSLLHRSIRDNLLYGRPEASAEDLDSAIENAEARSFIDELVDSRGSSGLDALVGERGVKLSGGQRQRIAIARVMLKNAPILLLDEATSALDSEAEASIQRSLYRLMKGKTVIAVAHRLSTIAAMDRLIVMEGGSIVEEGDHASLLARRGLYARLWARQSGGFLTDEADEADDDDAADGLRHSGMIGEPA